MLDLNKMLIDLLERDKMNLIEKVGVLKKNINREEKKVRKL